MIPEFRCGILRLKETDSIQFNMGVLKVRMKITLNNTGNNGVYIINNQI